MKESDPLPTTEDDLEASRGLDALPLLDMLRVFHAADEQAWRALAGALPEIARLAERVAEALLGDGRLVYAGAGTSGRLGVLDASECPPTFGVAADRVIGLIAGGDRALRDAIEGAEDDADEGARVAGALDLTPRDVVCGIAASGRTPWVWGLLEVAHARGAACALITTNARIREQRDTSSLDHLIVLPVGPEVIAGSTRLKSGTATKMALNMISSAAMVRAGKVYDNLMVDVRATNAKLLARATRLVARLGEVELARAADLFERSGRDVRRAVVMARRGVGVERATEILAAHRGSLRAAIEDR